MDYHIALDPNLGVNAADFVEAWNAEPECRAIADASLAESAPPQLDLFSTGIAALGGVATGVVANAIYDRIRTVFARKKVSKRTEYVQLDQPDGTRLIVVKIVES